MCRRRSSLARAAGRIDQLCAGIKENRLALVREPVSVLLDVVNRASPSNSTLQCRRENRRLYVFLCKSTAYVELLAEKQGFEPWIRYNRIPDFESGAFDHSATSPCLCRAADYSSAAAPFKPATPPAHPGRAVAPPAPSPNRPRSGSSPAPPPVCGPPPGRSRSGCVRTRCSCPGPA